MVNQVVTSNKKKIVNDPLYGLISIPNELIFDLIEHPYFQRLRRIRQLGLTEYVYPGATHSRFQHALGAMHLMHNALKNLKDKGTPISEEEQNACLAAILLHDIGHGPFSHTLEQSLLPSINHEAISILIMKKLNREFNGQLGLAIEIFTNTYPRRFFHQLVSSQLDIDRIDYLNRDSFFTGVSEGTIGSDRIIRMLNVKQDQLVVEEKGIYSIENFLSARRLMYWQVYLHKTTICVDKMLVQTIRRAKWLVQKSFLGPLNSDLQIFLEQNITFEDLGKDEEILKKYASLDDSDIWSAIKIWKHSEDKILSTLSGMLLERKLFRLEFSNKRFDPEIINTLLENVKRRYEIEKKEAEYLIIQGITSNSAYLGGGQKINILTKTGKIIDVAKVAELPNIRAMSKIVKKYYLCWPKNVSL